MIAESFLDVIGMFSFLAFHIPVSVSITMANPIKKSIPVIGKKKAPIMPSNFVDAKRIFVNNMNSCVLMDLYLQ